jgi:hypothetical protein
MANETKSTAAPVKETKSSAAPATATAPVERGGEDLFRAIFKDGKPVEPTKKVAPQAQVLINTIRAAGKEGVKRAQLVQNLKGVLTTRQPEGRILSYYQKLLTESGAVEIVKAPVAPIAPPAAK